ncbi:MAG TPA: site-specific DNA-methyltransferase [Firmicutes bacterium]|nr:site-specific DNA-methyltransferase [Bacillota bacterium]
MYTKHTIIYQDARKLSTLSDNSIDLVVTSPPYPMIKMWDELFIQIDPDIGKFFQRGDYYNAFEAMHRVLDDTWRELFRVLKNGAIACINIGDATRTIGKRFQLFANHSRVQSKFFEIGFDVLPLILWRKQTNAPNKFMGSGMLPAGAYVTLEHEYILIFRKGTKRVFATPEEKHNRMLSSFFWEERNIWFSDIWDFKGIRQQLNDKALRNRSAAFPFLLPFRLVNMYSVFGDTVLDPFLGTGTTTLAAIAAGRDSIGYEIDHSFSTSIKDRIVKEKNELNKYNLERIRNHIDFIQARTKEKGNLNYTNNYFGLPVMTKQETELKLPFVKSIEEKGRNLFKASYFSDKYIKSINPFELSCEKLQIETEIQ